MDHPTSPFRIMKPWLLSVIVVGLCAGTLGWVVRYRVIPRFLASANEECVADWHAALTECREETGSWPDLADISDFTNRVFVVKSSDGRRVDRGYMTGRPWSYSNGILFDAYKQPMRITRDGEHVVVSSAGANLTWGDADDVTSDQVKERYQPTTLAKLRAAAEEEILRKKRKTGPAEKGPGLESKSPGSAAPLKQ